MKTRMFKRITLIAAFIVLLAGVSFAADQMTGKVNVDVLNVRAEPSLSAKIVGKAYIGEQVVILEGLGDWYKIQTAGGEKYVMSKYVDLITVAVAQPAESAAPAADQTAPVIQVGMVNGSVVNVRASASTTAPIVAKLGRGTKVTVNATENGWCSITAGGITGYMHSDYVLLMAGSDAPLGADATLLEKGQAVVNYSYQFLGTRYRYGGDTPEEGFDCSGFTMYVYQNFGISLTHGATAQSKEGASVDKASLIPGDLVFFRNGGSGIGHVGIYVGNGDFIHATVPGDVVKVEALSQSYYLKNYVCAVRVLK